MGAAKVQQLQQVRRHFAENRTEAVRTTIIGWRIGSMLLTGHQIGVLERQRQRFERHWPVVVQELAADVEEVGGGRDAANLVQELAGRLDAHAEVVEVFLHLLHLR